MEITMFTYYVCDNFGQTLHEYDNEQDAMEQCNYNNDEFVSRQVTQESENE
jgi:ABC-type transporter MlaC component